MENADVHYKIGWRAKGTTPGHHPSHQPGGGLHFRNHVSLIDAPDPRRFDIRASLRDPFEQIQVRLYQQTSAIQVFVVADLSASMTFEGAHKKRDVIANFVASMSYSAYRTGDSFGFYGSSNKDRGPILQIPTFNRAAGVELANRLRHFEHWGTDARGLSRAVDFIGAKRSLVFLISDFHFPTEETETLMSALAYHDVVPVVVWDRFEYEQLPNFGLARVSDPETGRSRLLFVRQTLKQRIGQKFAVREKRLDELFARFGREPLKLSNGFEADEVSRYFLR